LEKFDDYFSQLPIEEIVDILTAADDDDFSTKRA
jgi:hypothetical protein